MLDLIRSATLAANGHNTQPWKVRPREDGIDILPDLVRRRRVVDPDDHHLFVGLGCAAENLALAVSSHRRPGRISFDPAAGEVATRQRWVRVGCACQRFALKATALG